MTTDHRALMLVREGQFSDLQIVLYAQQAVALNA